MRYFKYMGVNVISMQNMSIFPLYIMGRRRESIAMNYAVPKCCSIKAFSC